jgi:hypothetical protein
MPASATAAPRITGRHELNRRQVVADMAAFLLRRFADVGTYAETVEDALAFACGLSDAQWGALGQKTGHYANGATPDHETTAAVLAHLEQLLPVTADDPSDLSMFEGLPR